MKQNTYFQHMYKRTNLINEFILRFFLAISSWPRLLIEVFFRHNFGERYFSAASVITLLIILGLVPYVAMYGGNFFSPYRSLYNPISGTQFLITNFTWYAYLAAFAYMSFKRYREVKELPSVYEFKRFSLSTGQFHPFLTSLEFGGKTVDARTISIIVEPGIAFVFGFILSMMDQPIGGLLISCSVVYSLSYRAAYHLGDTYIMDKIDALICSEDLVRVFTDDTDTKKSRGFDFYGRRPANAAARRRMAELFEQDEETADAI